MKEFSTCSFLGRCSGCSLGPDILFPPTHPDICSFFKTDVPLICGEKVGWRMKAKLAVRGSASFPQIGLFREGSHDVVEIQNCLANHPSINTATQLLREAIIRQKTEPYNEQKQSGDLRYVQFHVSRETKKVQIVLVAREKNAVQLLAKDLWSQADLWHSIWINVQPSPTNQIFGNEWHFCRGEPWLWQKTGRERVAFHPAAFSQANLVLFDRILAKLETWVPTNARLLEIYAGVGAISLHLSPYWQSAKLVEDNPFAQSSFLQTISTHAFKPMQYLQESAARAPLLLSEADCVIVDPPRKGLDPALLRSLETVQSKTLIYISCALKSFKFDAQHLMDSGWILGDAAVYWLFPGTDHVEIVTKWNKP